MTIIAIICALIGGFALGWTAAAAWFSKKMKEQEMHHALELSDSFYGDEEDDELPDGYEFPLDERQREIYEKMFGKPE